MIAKFLVRCDFFILQRVCEPFLERIIKCSQRDVFILARRWYIFSYGVICAYAVYMVICTAHLELGIVFCIIAASRVLMMSRLLWKWFARYGYSDRIRHPYDREIAKILYHIYGGADNPLKFALAYKRIQTLIAVVIGGAVVVSHVGTPSFVIVWGAFLLFFVGHMIWLYIRSCTMRQDNHFVQVSQRYYL